ncbi:MAG: MBL fold metallo-hydrolase [Chloroflexi bacterium]|nr:MBL fold metallo-hydrolase [Chloroflexota bacterium]
MSRAKVIMLGSGTPNAEADRAGSGLAVVVDGRPYLVDCGHGVVQRVVQAHAGGLISWDTTALDRLFVTHLHADHTVGIPDLLYTPWIHGREAPLQAWGPAGLEQMLAHIQLAWAENIREHRSAHPCSEHGYQARATEAQAGCVYCDERLEVHALPADHGDLAAFSYKFVTPAGTVVVSGDTKPVPGFADWARGCDLLVHEVYSARQWPERPPAWRAYHARVHTSTRELAALANEIRPGCLWLYHQLFWGLTPDELVAELSSEYDGDVVSTADLDMYDL